MKKLLYLFTASLLVFTSCSKDDNDSSEPAPSILIKKITTLESDGSSSTENIVYNGNKIVSLTDAEGVAKYTYTGGLITKIEEVDKDGKLHSTTDYSYINGKLDNDVRKSTDETFYYKTKYTHNVDGTVSYEGFRGVVPTDIEEKFGAIGKYTFKDDNMMKLEVFYTDSVSSYMYEYDTKNHPFKNVLGYNLLLDDVSVNNVVKQTSTSGSGDNIRTGITTYTYKYDANNYPTERVETYQSGNSTATETTQYVY